MTGALLSTHGLFLPARRLETCLQPHAAPTVDLNALIRAATPEEPRVLTVWAAAAAAGQPACKSLAVGASTLETGFAEQAQLTLGYVEQFATPSTIGIGRGC